MTNNEGKNTTLEHSFSTGDSSMTTGDVKVVRRTINYIPEEMATL